MGCPCSLFAQREHLTFRANARRSSAGEIPRREEETAVNGSNENATLWNWLALLVSAVAVAGSLWLSLGVELVGCPLCFYQRTFAMCAFGVLLVGLLSG